MFSIAALLFTVACFVKIDDKISGFVNNLANYISTTGRKADFMLASLAKLLFNLSLNG